MKNGVDDIKKHRWFAGFDYLKLLKQQLPAPYVPPFAYSLSFSSSNPGDTTNFSPYPDSESEPVPLKPTEDPFIDWA